MQRDPAGYVDGMSLYGLPKNSPQRHTDPNGLWVYYKKCSKWSNYGNPFYQKVRYDIAIGRPIDLPTGPRASLILEALKLITNKDIEGWTWERGPWPSGQQVWEDWHIHHKYHPCRCVWEKQQCKQRHCCSAWGWSKKAKEWDEYKRFTQEEDIYTYGILMPAKGKNIAFKNARCYCKTPVGELPPSGDTIANDPCPGTSP
jgi:hypothetical protein